MKATNSPQNTIFIWLQQPLRWQDALKNYLNAEKSRVQGFQSTFLPPPFKFYWCNIRSVLQFYCLTRAGDAIYYYNLLHLCLKHLPHKPGQHSIYQHLRLLLITQRAALLQRFQLPKRHPSHQRSQLIYSHKRILRSVHHK